MGQRRCHVCRFSTCFDEMWASVLWRRVLLYCIAEELYIHTAGSIHCWPVLDVCLGFMATLPPSPPHCFISNTIILHVHPKNVLEVNAEQTIVVYAGFNGGRWKWQGRLDFIVATDASPLHCGAFTGGFVHLLWFYKLHCIVFELCWPEVTAPFSKLGK